ncbi:MAG: methionine gamma-lyase [Clostridiaceae bacterium]|nr:methionine gamma-lyase [Clostridiaceae bacterium]
MDNQDFATRQIHAGSLERENFRPLVMPIHQSATFYFDSVEQGAALFAGEEDGYFYTRIDNPNQRELATRLAELEGGESGLVFASGMGAISSMFWSLVRSGDHIIANKTLYGCTYELLYEGFPRFNIDVDFVDLSVSGILEKFLRPETRIVYIETPANPNLKISDINYLASTAHTYNPEIKVVVDNTFATPYLQQPLGLGADIVVHSSTKYLNGHGDVVAGAVISDAATIKLIADNGLRYFTGSVLGPFECFLISRGLKTLDLRMEKHCANAREVAEFLEQDKRVKNVNFPGLPSHPAYKLAQKQMKLPGAMISFELAGNKEYCANFVNNCKLCRCAVSLGDAETLIQHPASMTHNSYSPEALADAGIAENLLRISVGLESASDIIADLKQALDHCDN